MPGSDRRPTTAPAPPARKLAGLRGARAERTARNGSHTRGVATMTNEQIEERIKLLERMKELEEGGE